MTTLHSLVSYILSPYPCRMIKLHSTLLLILVLSISACGFHLRGSQSVTTTAISGITISDAAAPGVGNEVRTLLETLGSTIVTDTDEAEYNLHLAEQLLDKSVLSVSAVTGKVEQYQLTLTVRMTVTDADQAELLSGQQIRITRDYAFNDQAVLGSVSEERVLEQEMVRQAASQIVRRLNALAGK